MEIEIKTRKDLIKSISIFLIGIGVVIIILSLTVFTSAIYPGETETYPNEMGTTNLVYAVVGNSSPINVLVEVNLTNITITIPGDAIPDDYSLVFMENITNTIIKTVTQTIHTGGGGGGSTKYVDRNVTVFEPKFYDRNITNTIEVDKEIIKEVKIESSPIWFYISIFVILLCILIGVLYLRLKSSGEIYE